MKKGDRVKEVDPQHDGVTGTVTSIDKKKNLANVRWDCTRFVSTTSIDGLKKV